MDLPQRRSVNGRRWPGRAVPDVETLGCILAEGDRQDAATLESPAHASAEDLELLQRIHALGPLGPFARVRSRGSVDRLTREGLLTLDGVLADAGEAFMGPVSSPQDVLAVRGRVGQRTTLLQGWISGAAASVVSGAPGPDLLASVDGADRAGFTALTVDRGSLASHVCDWAGVRPFGSVLEHDLLLAEDRFTRRTANGCEPVPDVAQVQRAEGEPVDAEALAAWWGTPWFVWEVTSARLGVNLGLISAQGAGNYVFGVDSEVPDDDGAPLVRVAPVGAQAVWEALWLLTHGGGSEGAAGRPVLGGAPQHGRLRGVPPLPRSVD